MLCCVYLHLVGQLLDYSYRLHVHETLRDYCKLISIDDRAFVKCSAGFCTVLDL
jgi:hypothetical protein